MQESIYETLTRQYELAKVEEAKEIPTVRVLDEPQVPERKSFPQGDHRLLGILLSAFVGITWIFASALWTRLTTPPTERRRNCVVPLIRGH